MIRTSIVGCSRCYGEGHADLEFEELTYPVEAKVVIEGELVDVTMTHWAPCPTNGQPILMVASLFESEDQT